MRRAVITGMGLVSCLGNELETFWSRLVAGERGLSRITRFDTTGLRNDHGGVVRDFAFCPREYGLREAPDEATQFAVAASGSALADANLVVDEALAERAGLVFSTNFGGALSWDGWLPDATREGRLFREFDFRTAADHAARALGLRGPHAMLSLSCASGAAALGRCLETIRAGRAEVMLAGGHDSLAPSPLAGLSILRTITTDDIRPFDAKRSGTLFSEGAAVLVVEEFERARARGARVYCELRGAGQNNNAYHMTAPDPGGVGMVRVVRRALADACLLPEEIGYINAHGTGTEHHDPAETEAIKTVFGDQAYRLPISSSKGALGHMMAAAGTVEAIVTALAIRDGVVPLTANLHEPDPACDLDYVPGESRQQAVACALSISAGIGGSNAAVVLRAV